MTEFDNRFNKKNIIKTKFSECGEYKYVTYKGYSIYKDIMKVYENGELIFCYYNHEGRQQWDTEVYKDNRVVNHRHSYICSCTGNTCTI